MNAEYKNALDVYKDEILAPRMYTGFADLDSLLGGGIKKGSFCLFYGDEKSGIDFLIHKILVHSLVPESRHGFGGKAIYVNCGNYKYERTVFDIESIGRLMKSAGIDHIESLDNVYTFCAFNEEQQEYVTEQIRSLLENDSKIRSVVVHNISKLFFETAHTPDKNIQGKIPRLQRIIGRIHQACARHGAALIVSGRPTNPTRVRVPNLEGGRYLRHVANILVYLRRVGRSKQVQAFLVKHPRAPRRAVNFAWIEGENLGRITIPFRTRWEDQVGDLKRTFREALMDQHRQHAFDDLSKLWSSELGAMSQCNIPTVLDIMLLTAVVDNRKQLLDVKGDLSWIKEKL
ncbi:MAG: hypothetical protein ACE5KO_03515 [Candidatus Bathyarchaeia archaeon]